MEGNGDVEEELLLGDPLEVWPNNRHCHMGYMLYSIHSCAVSSISSKVYTSGQTGNFQYLILGWPTLVSNPLYIMWSIVKALASHKFEGAAWALYDSAYRYHAAI